MNNRQKGGGLLYSILLGTVVGQRWHEGVRK